MDETQWLSGSRTMDSELKGTSFDTNSCKLKFFVSFYYSIILFNIVCKTLLAMLFMRL